MIQPESNSKQAQNIYLQMVRCGSVQTHMHKLAQAWCCNETHRRTRKNCIGDTTTSLCYTVRDK